MCEERRMYAGFPKQMIPWLGCPHGCGGLRLEENASTMGSHIVDGALTCVGNGHEFAIAHGVVRMLGSNQLDDESENERIERD
jgi:hypothetical protein